MTSEADKQTAFGIFATFRPMVKVYQEDKQDWESAYLSYQVQMAIGEGIKAGRAEAEERIAELEALATPIQDLADLRKASGGWTSQRVADAMYATIGRIKHLETGWDWPDCTERKQLAAIYNDITWEDIERAAAETKRRKEAGLYH